MCTQESKPDLMNPGSNSSGMGSAAGSSSAGSPASKPNTTTHGTEYSQPPESNSSPASTHVCFTLYRYIAAALTVVRVFLIHTLKRWLSSNKVFLFKSTCICFLQLFPGKSSLAVLTQFFLSGIGF